MSSHAQLLAFFIVAAVAAFGLYQANEANKLARAVDHRGDIRACTQENIIRRDSNERNAALEQTAILVVDAFQLLADEQKTTAKNRLNNIARRASAIQTDFPRAGLTDCSKAFPGP